MSKIHALRRLRAFVPRKQEPEPTPEPTPPPAPAPAARSTSSRRGSTSSKKTPKKKKRANKSALSLFLASAFLVAATTFAGTVSPPSAAVFITEDTPANGVNCTQALHFDNNITSGSFSLRFKGQSSGFITWSATSATLRSRIKTALESISAIGSGGVDVSEGDGFSGGHGDINVQFQGARVQNFYQPVMTVGTNSLVGSTHTLTITITVEGVTADGRNSRRGTFLYDNFHHKFYINFGVPGVPSWTEFEASVANYANQAGSAECSSGPCE